MYCSRLFVPLQAETPNEAKMMVTNIGSACVNNYWNIIKHLSPEAKIDLITLLSQSLKTESKETVSAKKYYGIWGDDGMTDEEFVNELHSLRSFNKEIVAL